MTFLYSYILLLSVDDGWGWQCMVKPAEAGAKLRSGAFLTATTAFSLVTTACRLTGHEQLVCTCLKPMGHLFPHKQVLLVVGLLLSPFL